MSPRAPHVWIVADRPSGEVLRAVAEDIGVAAEEVEPPELLRRLTHGKAPYGLLVREGSESALTTTIMAFASQIERVVVLSARVPFDPQLPGNVRLLRDAFDEEKVEAAFHWLWGSADGGTWWADQVGTGPTAGVPA